ncbi:MAG: FtsW/RodA/SpoVE family cell cycle protein [Bacteroidetes bacterium]|jgi:cell division protein FtsW|nr:FtsW/RodA/SpoVE family cell cycle protein [Bacteroidota bacterium]
MSILFKHIKGDKVIWAIVAMLGLLSFMPIYSSSTNLVNVVGSSSSTFGILVKHAFLMFSGFLILLFVHKINYKYFSSISVIALVGVIFLLVYTLTQDTTIGGASAKRWIEIPFIGLSFQTSSLANVILMTYIARFLALHKDKEITFKESFKTLWLPIIIVLALIVPENLSTSGLIFVMAMMLLFVGGYPLRYLIIIGVTILMFLTLFIGINKAFPDLMPKSRVSTWISRIENFKNPDADEGYQVEKAKIAIATGLEPTGPGKSVQKNFLPQSSSDFIFAIIIEEFGIILWLPIILLYILLLIRFIVNAQKAPSTFGTLMVIGVGFPIIFQAILNMMVAVNLIPVTGQNLPLISSGGTSIWMISLAIGMILSVSAAREREEANLAEENTEENQTAIETA